MTRALELDEIDDLVARARGSRSASLVVVGDPGVGKSWLCERAREIASGFRVIGTRGVESESHLGYAGLFDIVSPLLEGALERLAPARADALRGALRLNGPAMPDRLAVAVACLDMLADAAHHSPLLVVVDDAHWVDAPTLEVLRFVARRLDADRVALLFAERGGTPEVGGERLELGPLTDADAYEVLDEFAGQRVRRRVARRLIAATAGNPLALRHAVRELSREQLDGHASLPEILPAAADPQSHYQRVAAGAPADTRQAWVLLAAAEAAPAGVIDRALAELRLKPASFSSGVAAGLVRVDAGRPRFEHPLVRAAVWDAAAPLARRAVHRALAIAWGESGDGERAAWHQAAAADGVDAGGSLAMVHAARMARARGAPQTAAQAWRRAAELQPDPGQLAQLRLEEACDLARGGRAGELLAQTAEILSGELPPVLRADFEMLRGHALVWQGQITDAAGLFAEAAARIRSTDAVRAVRLLAGTAFALATCGDIEGAVHSARGAAELAEGAGGGAEASARATLGWALILAGDGRNGYPLLLASHDHTSDDDQVLSLLAPLAPARLGQFACWMEDYGTARRELERSVARTRDAGALGDLPHALGALAELEFRLGDWTASRTHAEEAVRLGEDVGQHFHYAHIVLGQLDAATGDAEASRARIERVLALDEHRRSESLRVYTSAALGLLELSLDRPDRAADHLLETKTRTERAGLAEPNVVQWTGDLIESQCRAGRTTDAARELAHFERQAERTGRRWALAAAARCRGLLATAGDVDDAVAEATRRIEDVPSPFERGRTALCLGERLRRDGSRVEARKRLNAALEAFDSIGAAPWTEKAARELRSSGAHPRRARIRSDALTPQETQISALVAEGRTNKDIAGTLFLSPKTVEFHLGHVYRKLGITNRTQLARTLLLAGSPADER